MSLTTLFIGGISPRLLITHCGKGMFVFVFDQGDASLSSGCCRCSFGEISLVWWLSVV